MRTEKLSKLKHGDRKMRRIIFFILFVTCCTTAIAQERPIATTSCDRTMIEVFFKSGQAIPGQFAHSAGDRKLYSLVELQPANEPGVISRDRSGWLKQTETGRCVGANCGTLQIPIDRALPPGQTFILALADFTAKGEPITLRFESPVVATAPPKVEITTGPDFYSQSSELQLRSSADINVIPTVTVNRVHYTISSDGLTATKVPEPITASVVRETNQLYVLKLKDKLARGKEYFLQVNTGITDSLGQNIVAEGTVKVRPISSKSDELGIDVNLSSDVAVHQRPIFQFVGKYKRTNMSESDPLFGDWRWEPTASADVGLNSTKSANAVTLEPFNLVNEVFTVPVDQYQGAAPPKLQTQTTGLPPTNPSSYANFVHTPWYKFSNLKVTAGPKFEFDRNFKRKNVLGGLRFDLNFHRWNATLADKRDMLKEAFGDDVGARTRVRFGFQIVPFVAFDFGGHVNNETVHKKVNGVEKSVFVPRHKIFRSYAGFTSVFEFDEIGTPITLTIEEWIVHLASRESIGFSNDDGAFLRSLRGFHHRGKATLAFAVGRSKHYSLTLTYENGRQAPNLEYLNKLGTGIKVVY
jgi:hypothetical protein